MRVLILSSLSFSLVNFRGQLLRAMVAQGHYVVASAPDRDPEVEAKLAAMGVHFVQTPMARAGSNPVSDLRTVANYLRLILSERPGIVVAYTQKPIIYGGLAARLAGGCRFFALMSGLGYVFSQAADDRPLLRRIVRTLYRSALRGAETVFVFNRDDREEMLRQGILSPRQHVVQVPGSGVDVDYFRSVPVPSGDPTFLMIGRYMRDKGIADFIAAAKIVRQRHPKARFQLLGRAEDQTPTSVSRAEVEQWAGDSVELIDETRDVRPYLAASTVFVLPSFYREGLPRTILEAMATGRPIVTTDMPGCREPVIPHVNGLLVPPQDAEALAAALSRFIDEPGLARRMGKESRRIAEREYDVTLVNSLLLSEMGLCSGEHRGSKAAPAATHLATEGGR
jgi:glycosyltransferase involved in cell wall biosynthesis